MILFTYHGTLPNTTIDFIHGYSMASLEFDDEPVINMSQWVNDQDESDEPSLSYMTFWWFNYQMSRDNRREDIRPVPPKLSPSTEYDIVVAVYLHGEITTHCPTEYKPNFSNTTIIEATPCGVGNFCQPTCSNKTLQTAIDRYRKDPLFVHKLQEELVQERDQHIRIYEKDKSLIPAKLTDAYELYKTVKPWRIIEKGYLEREYTSDDQLNKIIVYYASRGPFELHQNIYDTFRVETRTELMDVLKEGGYIKPLIVDFSCGVFKNKSFDSETCAAKRQLQYDMGVGGRNTKRKRRSRKTRHRVNKLRTRV